MAAKKKPRMSKATSDLIYKQKHHPEQVEKEDIEDIKRSMGYEYMHEQLVNSDRVLSTLSNKMKSLYNLNSRSLPEEWSKLGISAHPKSDEAWDKKEEMHSNLSKQFVKRFHDVATKQYGSTEAAEKHYYDTAVARGNEVIRQLSSKGLSHWTRLLGNGINNFVETSPNKFDLAPHMTPQKLKDIEKFEQKVYPHRKNLSSQQFIGDQGPDQLTLF